MRKLASQKKKEEKYLYSESYIAIYLGKVVWA